MNDMRHIPVLQLLIIRDYVAIMFITLFSKFMILTTVDYFGQTMFISVYSV